MKSKRTKAIGILLSLAGFAFFIGVWWLVSWAMEQNRNYLLPGPGPVFLTLVDFLFGAGAGTTYLALLWTLVRLLIGFAISFVLGALLGTLGGLFPPFASFMKPFVGFARSIPTAAFVLILIGIFYKATFLSPYTPCFLVFLVAFPLIYEAFVSGIVHEDKDTKDALALDGGARSLRAIVDVLWPDSLSYIFLALAQSLGLSIKVSVMSEILTNSSSANGGIGGLIQNAELSLDMKSVIAYSLVAILLVLLIDIPMHYLKKKAESVLG